MFTDCRARCVSVNVCVNVCSLSVEHGVCACLYLHACGTSAVLSVEHGVCVCVCVSLCGLLLVKGLVLAFKGAIDFPEGTLCRPLIVKDSFVPT